MVLSGQAHGKLLLFGEHAMVHGFPALGLTLPMYTRVCLSAQGDIPSDTPDQASLVQALVPYMGPDALHLWQTQAWHVSIESNVPMDCGLGSSAALTGALARAIDKGITGTKGHTVAQMAHQAEHYFHGHPSGVDTTLALGEGLVTCRRVNASLLSTEPCTIGPFAMVVGTVPRTTCTRDLVAHVQTQILADRDATLILLSQLGNLAVLPKVTESAWAVLGDRANEAQGLLRTLGVSTSTLDKILSTGLAAGARGGKLSGAGGGGAFVLFCKDTASAQEVARAVNQCDPCQTHTYQWDGRVLLTFGDTAS